MASKKRPTKPPQEQKQQAERAFSEPSVRVQTLWTPARIRTVAAQADGGNIQPIADLCDQVIRDDRFGENLQTLADSVLGADLKWEAGLRKRRQKPDEKVPLESEADNDWWETYHEAEYAQIVVWREMLGFCWARKVWQISDKTGRWVPLLIFWHPRHFRYDTFQKQWFVKIDEIGTEVAIEAGADWVVFYRRGVTRPWADGQWRGLSRWWMLKALAISDWGVHSEKAARQVISSDDSVNAADRKALAADLYALSKDGVVVLPKGFVYSLVEATANTRDIYQAQVDAANMAGTVAILGQNLTTEISDNGSRAAGQVHERKEGRKVRYISESLSTTLHEQVMLEWARQNFGGAQEPPWHVWQVTPPADLGAKATTYSTVATAIATLKSVGKAIPDDKLKEEFGIELIDVEPTAPPANDNPPKPGEKKPPGQGQNP